MKCDKTVSGGGEKTLFTRTYHTGIADRGSYYESRGKKGEERRERVTPLLDSAFTEFTTRDFPLPSSRRSAATTRTTKTTKTKIGSRRHAHEFGHGRGFRERFSRFTQPIAVSKRVHTIRKSPFSRRRRTHDALESRVAAILRASGAALANLPPPDERASPAPRNPPRRHLRRCSWSISNSRPFSRFTIFAPIFPLARAIVRSPLRVLSLTMLLLHIFREISFFSYEKFGDIGSNVREYYSIPITLINGEIGFSCILAWNAKRRVRNFFDTLKRVSIFRSKKKIHGIILCFFCEGKILECTYSTYISFFARTKCTSTIDRNFSSSQMRFLLSIASNLLCNFLIFRIHHFFNSFLIIYYLDIKIKNRFHSPICGRVEIYNE